MIEANPTQSSEQTVFPLLAQPEDYRACVWNLAKDDLKREYWLTLFKRHFHSLMDEARREARDRGDSGTDTDIRLNAAQLAFNAYIEAHRAKPGFDDGRLDILKLCDKREDVLRTVGIDDPYRLAKQRQTEQAINLLPAVLTKLDEKSADALTEAIIKAVFAGNIFDLGATRTVGLFEEGKSFDFNRVLGELKPRPWLVDDYDTFEAHLREAPYEAALLFVDNAGPDIVLGMLPFARWLLQRGARVVLTANSKPSLNDITHDELLALLDRVAPLDPTLGQAIKDGRLQCVPSGNGAPLIHLAAVSPELAGACDGIDLVVLEGMGRAVESNFDAKLTCDCLKIAMLKDEDAASTLGGQVYDLVLKFEQP